MREKEMMEREDYRRENRRGGKEERRLEDAKKN